jgi:glycosyltransferase involved in cell wall biosynthesis
MKVALISFHQNQTGGGAVAAAEFLVKGLIQSGIDVVEISSHRSPWPEIIQRGKVKTYRFFPWNVYWVGDKSRYDGLRKALFQLIDTWNPHVYRTVKRILRTERPDIVHVMKLRGLSPALWSAAAATGCRPLIQTCHDYELMSPDGVLQGRIGQWAREGKWMLRPYQSLRARVSRHVDVATAPSRYTLTTLTRHGFFPRAEHLVVPNTHGYSLTELEQCRMKMTLRPSPSPPTECRLLYFGRLETNKGIEGLCLAVAQAAQRWPNLRLDVGGSGIMESRLVQTYGDHPNICFHGYVSGAQKEVLLANADLLVLPSVVSEVFGIVIVEAYAYGKPVIASRAGGIPELVQEGQTGFLVEPGNVAALQRAVEHACENGKLVAEMSKACFAAARRYSFENQTEQYLRAYEIGLGRG